MTTKYNVDEAIKGCLVGAIVTAQGNMRQVSLLTGLSRATCYRLIVKYRLSLKEIRSSVRYRKLEISQLG